MSRFTQSDADRHRALAAIARERYDGLWGAEGTVLSEQDLAELEKLGDAARWHDGQADEIEAMLRVGAVVRLVVGDSAFWFQLPDAGGHSYSFSVDSKSYVTATVDGKRMPVRMDRK